MRTALWILALGVAAGGLLLLFLDDLGGRGAGDRGGPVAGDGADAGPLTTEQAEGPRPLTVKEHDVIQVVGAKNWRPHVFLDGEPVSDPRILNTEVVSPDGENHVLTGKDVIRILREKLGKTDLQFRFKDQASLDAFESRTFKVPTPSRAPLQLILENCAEIGYRVLHYGDAIYVTPIEKPPEPGEPPPGPPPPSNRPPLPAQPEGPK
jgi:hypothetical protein